MNNRVIHRRVLKASAMSSLSGNWLSAFMMTIIPWLISAFIMNFLPIKIPTDAQIMAANDPAAFLSLFVPRLTDRTIALILVVVALSWFVLCPLEVGVRRFFLAVAKGEKAKIRIIFSPFGNISTVFSSMGLNLIITVLAAFWAVVLVFVPTLVAMLGRALGIGVVAFFASLLSIIGIVVCVLWTSRYSFAIYIFAEGRNGGAWRSFMTARKLIRGFGGELMALRATYFGWDIACSIIPGLMLAYNAMERTTYAKYLYYLRGELKIQEAESNEAPRENDE